MKNIILVRHTNAEEISSGNDDFRREITPKGKEKAIFMAGELKMYYSEHSAFMTSSAARAYQTAEIFADVMGHPASKIIKRDFLYHYYTFEQLIPFLSGVKSDTVWIFGHNPMMCETASKMSKRCFDSFPKCAAAGFFFKVADYSEISHGNGNQLFYLKPK